jgi:hypothetical protein
MVLVLVEESTGATGLAGKELQKNQELKLNSRRTTCI